MSVAAIQPIDLSAAQAPARMVSAAAAVPSTSFANLLTQGIDAANTKLVRADQLVAQAAVDTSIPLHQVTFALEEGRISFELLIQVRNRLIDASQQLLNMQL
jgi:flagellar hook-basal body complex protein FliE